MIHVDFFVGYMHTMWIFEFVDKTFCHNILLIFLKLFDELTGHGYDELTSLRDLRLIEIKIYTK